MYYEDTGLLPISYSFMTDELFDNIIKSQSILAIEYKRNKDLYKLNKNREEKRRAKERKRKIHFILIGEE
jgi:hypothetical protein